MKQILCGKIVKPQGIKGEVKMQSYVDNPQGFCSLRYVTINNKPIKIIKARADNDCVFLLLEGYSDRNAAEELRNCEVFVDYEAADIVKGGDYFVDEVIGLDAYVGEKHIGKVRDVLPNKGADVFVIEGDVKYMVPFLNKAIVEINIDKNIIIYDSDMFKEIAYEY